MKLLYACFLVSVAMCPGASIKSKPTEAPVVVVPEPPSSRIVRAEDGEPIPITARLRYATLVVLPKAEVIASIFCGDPKFWRVDNAANFISIKPMYSEHEQTNVIVITAAKHSYSFVVSLVKAQSDLAVVIEPQNPNLLASLNASAGIATPEMAEELREQARLAKEDATKARAEADQRIAEAEKAAATKVAMAKAAAPAGMVYDYTYTPLKEFGILAVWHDDKFTYIRANPKEAPVLMEMKDGKPSQIQTSFNDGLYTVPKIMDNAKFSIGKKAIFFVHKEH